MQLGTIEISDCVFQTLFYQQILHSVKSALKVERTLIDDITYLNKPIIAADGDAEKPEENSVVIKSVTIRNARHCTDCTVGEHASSFYIASEDNLPASLLLFQEGYLSADNLTIFNLNCSRCSAGVVQIIDTFFYFKNSFFKNSTALTGGAVYVTNSTLAKLLAATTTATSRRHLLAP